MMKNQTTSRGRASTGHAVWFLAICLLAASCVSTTDAGGSDFSPTVTAASAERLHDICGHLLLYYARHGVLPPDLEALRTKSSGELPPLVDPESGEPYVYYNPPLEIPGSTNRVLIHAPAIANASRENVPSRWIVLTTDPEETGQPMTQVVLLPESRLEEVRTSGKR